MLALTLPETAQVAGYLTAIVTCVLIVGRLAISIPFVKRLITWIRDGWTEDRATDLDRTLAFNGTGSFRNDMRDFYITVHRHMVRVDAHMARVDSARGQIRHDLVDHREQHDYE